MGVHQLPLHLGRKLKTAEREDLSKPRLASYALFFLDPYSFPLSHPLDQIWIYVKYAAATKDKGDTFTRMNKKEPLPEGCTRTQEVGTWGWNCWLSEHGENQGLLPWKLHWLAHKWLITSPVSKDLVGPYGTSHFPISGCAKIFEVSTFLWQTPHYHPVKRISHLCTVNCLVSTEF